MKARAAAGVAVAVVCCALAGCGSSSRDQVRAKVEQFAVAVAHHDAKTICGQVFAPSLVERFKSAGLTCQKGLQIFFSALHNPTLAVGPITVHGSRASASTLSGASGQATTLRPLELVKTSGGWRIAAVGAPTRSSGGTHGGGKTTGTTRTATTTTRGTAPKRPPAKKGSTTT